MWYCFITKVSGRNKNEDVSKTFFEDMNLKFEI